jgi:uncharacterized protein
MNRNEIIFKLKELKSKLKDDGFNLIGIFGSFAKDKAKESSDIDILYEIVNVKEYLKKYSGWNSINHIVDTKEFLQKELKRDVDFVDRDSLNDINKKYILKDLIYV